jgi:hypothetical protein
MPSTYTLNNGIELIATGEQSGTWGNTTNTNLELLDTALDGQVTVTLASAGTSGSPNTLPISDGTASNGRNRMVIFDDSSDLGATAYVQLTPNDAEKIIYVRNSLSGSRSILLFQGTYNASNDYEVPAGTTAVIYFDGAGTGAVAANVFNNAYFDSLRLGSVSVTAILDEDNMASDSATALATQQSFKAYVDTQVGANNELSEVLANGNTTGGTDISVSSGDDITFADNSKAIFGAGSDLQIYHDSTLGTSRIQDVGTGSLYIQGDGGVVITNSTGTSTSATFASTGATSLSYNGTTKFATTGTGVDITGTLTSDGLTVSGSSTSTFNSGAENVVATFTSTDTEAQINLVDTTGSAQIRSRNDLRFYTNGGSTRAMDIDSSGNVGIGTSSPSTNLHIQSTSEPAITLYHTAVMVSQIGLDSTGSLTFGIDGSNGSTERMRIDSSGNVGIGTSSPQTTLHVRKDDTAVVGLKLQNNTTNGIMEYQVGNDADNWFFGIDASDRFGISDVTGQASQKLVITQAGNVGIGTSSPNGKFETYSNAGVGGSNYSALVVDQTSEGGAAALSLTSLFTNTNNTNKEIAAIKLGTVTDGGASPNADIRFETVSSGTLSERMRIDSSGNVGIGEAPSVWRSADKALVVGNGASQYGNYVSEGLGVTYGSGWYRDTAGNFKYTLTGYPAGRFDYNYTGSNVFSWHQAAAGTAGNNITFTERMRIDSSGQVGIGTSSPLATLDVSDSTLSTIRLTSGSYQLTAYQYATGFSYLLTNGQLEIGTSGANILALKTNNTERLRIESGGDIEIKTASKYLRFNSPSSTFDFSGQPAGTDYLRLTTSSSGNFFFYADGALYNTTGTYGTISDLRLKENVVDATSKLDELMQLRVVNYNFKTSPDTKMLGFIAQEVEQVFPSLVEAGEEVSGEEPYKSIKTSVLVPMLVKAIQEQQLMIEALKTEMTSVKARLDALEGV